MIKQLTITNDDGGKTRFHFEDIITGDLTLVIAGFMKLAELEREDFAQLHWSDLTDQYEYRVRIATKPHKNSIALPDPNPTRDATS